MKKNEILIKFNELLKQCERDFNIIKKDFQSIEKFLPLSAENLENLLKNDKMLMLFDQIALRYIKLQDTLGKLLRNYFILQGENIDSSSMIDLINLAEKKNFNINEDLWFELRYLRNSITHEYPNDYEDISVAVNRLFELLPCLEQFLKNFY